MGAATRPARRSPTRSRHARPSWPSNPFRLGSHGEGRSETGGPLHKGRTMGYEDLANAMNSRVDDALGNDVGYAKGGGAFATIKAFLILKTEAEAQDRSEEHTSELQSLMRISYAVFCLKKKKSISNRTIGKKSSVKK